MLRHCRGGFTAERRLIAEKWPRPGGLFPQQPAASHHQVRATRVDGDLVAATFASDPTRMSLHALEQLIAQAHDDRARTTHYLDRFHNSPLHACSSNHPSELPQRW